MQIYNNNGYLQIDSNHITIAYTGKHRVSGNDNRSNTTIFAIQPDVNTLMCHANPMNPALPTGSGWVYEFGIATSKHNNGTGLEIYTENNAVAFSSSSKNMIILDKVVLADAFGSVNSFKRNYGHRNIAIVANQLPVHSVRTNNFSGYIKTIGFKISPNNDLTISDYPIEVTGGFNIKLVNELSFLVIDTRLY